MACARPSVPCGQVDRADYWSDGSGWDLEGLREDLCLYMKQADVSDPM